MSRHVELGWAVTGYGNQGDTTDIGIAVLEPNTTRAQAYVALTRGRQENFAIVIDEVGATDATAGLAEILDRSRTAKCALAVSTLDQLERRKPRHEPLAR